ncbi:MAG: 50S ribosomal protein L19 [Actinobacteria bacterium]|nr:MAG: 50S ribosomal protein L19 [Actinomycetota bacterium]
MNKTDLVERPRLREDMPDFRPGDALRVHVRVAEAGRWGTSCCPAGRPPPSRSSMPSSGSSRA